jgi:uncharacterized protein (TIGR00730 family)
VAQTGRAIAVFGSSEPRQGDALYEQAHELGRLLGAAGMAVVTGGYGGVMEAASRGAVESGGSAIGVPCDIFHWRSPNEYLTETIQAPDLHDRARRLVELAAGFIILEGKAGTLHELSLLWALHRAGCLEDRPVVLLGGRWRELLGYLEARRILEAPQIEISVVVDTVRQAVEAVISRIHPGKDGE